MAKLKPRRPPGPLYLVAQVHDLPDESCPVDAIRIELSLPLARIVAGLGIAFYAAKTTAHTNRQPRLQEMVFEWNQPVTTLTGTVHRGPVLTVLMALPGVRDSATCNCVYAVTRTAFAAAVDPFDGMQTCVVSVTEHGISWRLNGQYESARVPVLLFDGIVAAEG